MLDVRESARAEGLRVARGGRLAFLRRRRRLAALVGAALLALAALAAVFSVHVSGNRITARAPTIMLPPPSPPPKVEPQRLLPISPPDAKALNAKVPFVEDGIVPARPFAFSGSTVSLDRAVDCLAAAAWYEAGDDASGQRAVVQTVLNRARNPAFPPTVCGVVFQGSERTTGCQFTFTCDGSLARVPADSAWKRAQVIAAKAMAGAVDPRVGLATHYHADYVVPYWAPSLDKIAQVGAHIFYRWKGYWGSRSGFRRSVGDIEEPLVAKLALLSQAHRPLNADGTLAAVEAAVPAAAEDAVVAPVPEPIQLPGVREKSLRGALVRGTLADLFFIQLQPDTFPGNYATAALAICKGRPQCTVLGWKDTKAMATAVPLSSASGKALTFYYHRDDKGDERALWNCAEVDRSNKEQCLPSDTATLAGLQS